VVRGRLHPARRHVLFTASEEVKSVAAILGRWLTAGLSIIGLLFLFVACGATRQAFSFAECAPGKPVMSLGAFVSAGFGMSVCSVPKSDKSPDAR
jgi:hypothetical protein